jgi:hypothetical protein
MQLCLRPIVKVKTVSLQSVNYATDYTILNYFSVSRRMNKRITFALDHEGVYKITKKMIKSNTIWQYFEHKSG